MYLIVWGEAEENCVNNAPFPRSVLQGLNDMVGFTDPLMNSTLDTNFIFKASVSLKCTTYQKDITLISVQNLIKSA